MLDADIHAHVRAIQLGLKRTGRQMVLSRVQAVVRGLFVLVGCGIGYLLRGHSLTHAIGLWCAVGVVDLAVEFALYVRLARLNPEKFVSGLERQMLKFLFVVLTVAAALTTALLVHQKADLVIGVWMLLIGSAYVAVGLFSFSRTWVLGALACTGGAAALFTRPEWSLVILAAVLGLGSIVWGLIPAERDDTVE